MQTVYRKLFWVTMMASLNSENGIGESLLAGIALLGWMRVSVLHMDHPRVDAVASQRFPSTVASQRTYSKKVGKEVL